MTVAEFALSVTERLPFEPNDQQIKLIAALSAFCSPRTGRADSVFILNGYAGTGKTSVIGALVRALEDVKIPVALMAPTGRAAKVFGSLAHAPAHTIHRKLYRPPAPGVSAIAAPQPNRYPPGTIFMIDEASMISGEGLLQDLIHYVYGVEQCRAIFIGDTAQLPPVGCDNSPAMQPETFRAMGMRVTRATITAVARQGARSGILYNATMLRRAITADELPADLPLRLTGFADVRTTDTREFGDELSTAYAKSGISGTMLVTRSNRRAVDYNLAIRHTVLDYEDVIMTGEPVIVTKNNYFWTRNRRDIDFIANGDILYVEKIYGIETRGYLQYADLCLSMPDRGVTVDAKVLLSTLRSDHADLSPEQAQEIGRVIGRDPAALRSDPYYNALHIKYAYAVTCHKAQGGQWDNIFVDMGYLAPEAYGDITFYRWLYTAVTRARRCLTFVTTPE